MINYKTAKKILKKSKIKIKNQTINSLKSLNRVCAKDVYSPVNYPAGNNTAFDGYAINSKDTVNLNQKNLKKFKILKTIAAGDNPKIKNVKKFQTVEVMTGAIINKPFDTVIPIEQIKFYPNFKNKKYILVNKKIRKNEYIRYLGSDYKKNELVVKNETLIQPSHILAFKSLGIKKIEVKIKPNILFFSTGNEISDKQKIADWQVRNSNNYYIKSLSNSFLFNFVDGGILRDQDENLFKKLINKNIRSKADIIITSGAVSAGRFDFVPRVIKKFKLSNFFKDVAIRPGKPILFAKFKNKEKVFFGLPGNPIASAACFRFFVYPYLATILNIKEEKPFKARLKNMFKKKKNFTRFLKGRLTSTSNGNLEIKILQGQESFRIKSFVTSNVWGVFKAGQSIFKKSQLIECHSLITSNKNIFY
jgi:molybdopterin molybdotransferase